MEDKIQQLKEVCVKNPEDTESIQVLSDCLQEQQNPQGFLIAAELEIAKLLELQKEREAILETIKKDLEYLSFRTINGILNIVVNDLTELNKANLEKYVCKVTLDLSVGGIVLASRTEENSKAKQVNDLRIPIKKADDLYFFDTDRFENLSSLCLIVCRSFTNEQYKKIFNSKLFSTISYLEILGETNNKVDLIKELTNVAQLSKLKKLKIPSIPAQGAYYITISTYLAEEVKKDCLGVL